MLAEKRLDRAHDAGLAADANSLTDLKRLLAAQVPGRDHLVAAHSRSARAQLKRDLAAGSLKLAHILADPPPCARTAKVRDLLVAIPGIGPARASRTLSHCRIAEAKTVAGLSPRQRTALIDLLPP